jgi:hypothetical protein
MKMAGVAIVLEQIPQQLVNIVNISPQVSVMRMLMVLLYAQMMELVNHQMAYAHAQKDFVESE